MCLLAKCFSSSPSSSSLLHSLYLVFPARAPQNITAEQVLLGIEPASGRSAAEQAAFQLALLGSTLFISIIGGLLTGR